MFFLFVFFVFYLQVEQKLYWDIFSARDLQRAMGWMKGQFYWPGPEMTAGNNLPGPLFYFLLMPSLLFPGNAYSNSILWFTGWLALTYTLVFYFVEKTTKHKESIFIFLILFIASMGYSLLEPFKFGLNAGFAVLFHILALMGLYNYKQTHKNSHLYFVGLTVALGVQTHLLVLVHIITAILVFYLQKKRQLRTLLLFLFLSSLPFLIYISLDYLQIFSTSDVKWRYLNHLKTAFLDKSGRRNFNTNFTGYLLFGFFILILMYYRRWKGNKRFVSQRMKDLFIVTAAPLFVCFLGNKYFWYLYPVPGIFLLLLSKQFDDLISFGSPFSRKAGGASSDNGSHKKFIYLIICGAAVCILSPYDYVNQLKLIFIQNQNPPVIFFLAILILLLIISFSSSQTRGTKPYWEYGKIGILFCFLFCLILIHTKTASRTVEKKFPLTGVHPTYQEMYPLMKRIFLETALPAKSAMKHLYSTKIHFSISLLAYYSMTMEKITKHADRKLSDSFRWPYSGDLKRTSENHTPESPHGYMIIPHIKKFSDYSLKDWNQYLANGPLLSRFLRREITEKKILIKNSRLFGGYWLISYYTTEESYFPEGFHNTGQHYYWEEPEWLKKCKATKSFRNKEGFYYCMVLPGYKQRGGLKITFPKNATRHGFLNLFFYGPLIGLSKASTNSDGYALWSNIQLKVQCNSGMFHYTLPNIGLNYTDRQRLQIITPLKLRIPVSKTNFSCKKITKMELTFHLMFMYEDLKKIKVIW